MRLSLLLILACAINAVGTRDFPSIQLPTGTRPDIGAFELSASPYQAWRIENLGALPDGVTLAQDATADFDGDGINNLLEYAFGLSARMPSASPPLQSRISNQKLQISFPRNPAATDLTFTVQATSNIANRASWQPIAQSTAGTPFIPILGRSLVSASAENPAIVIALDQAPLSINPQRFLRLHVSQD